MFVIEIMRRGRLHFLREDGKPGPLLCAALFEGLEQARAALQKDSGGLHAILKLGGRTALAIRKHHLKRRARALFGLSAVVPSAILADRYEEAGLLEEAQLLRRKK